MAIRRGKGKNKSSEPEFGWQNMVLWERSKGDVLFSGYLEVTPEFIEHLLDVVDGGKLELTEEGKIKLGVSLRQSSSDKRNAPDLYGSIYELTEQEEEKPKRGRRKVQDDEDYDDDDDEPPKRGGRTSRSSGRSGRSSSRSSRSR